MRDYMMPTFNNELLKLTLTAEEFSLFERIISTQGKNKGALRVAKPKHSREDLDSCKAAYLWRMVAFQASPISAHHCMPMCADFDIPRDLNNPNYPKDKDYPDRWSNSDSKYWHDCKPFRDAHKALLKRLDDLADKITDTLPRNQLHGINRWGRALGAL